MRLLKPQKDNEVSSEKEKEKEELALIEKAISRLNKVLNDLKDEEGRERERIAREHEEFVSEKKKQKKEIENDLGKILAIKAIALEPLDKKKKELDEWERIISGQELLLSKREERIKNQAKSIYETAQKSQEQFDDVVERTKELDEREKKLKSEEKEFDAYKSRQIDFLKREKEKLRKLFESKSRNKK